MAIFVAVETSSRSFSPENPHVRMRNVRALGE
jgi:hypothetical protein